MSQINWDNKIGLIPKQTRINQVWDDDMNEIKAAVNDNYRFIQGFFVPTATNGRQVLQVNDKFWGFIGDRFVAGKVLDATADIAADVDDDTKIALAIDGEI